MRRFSRRFWRHRKRLAIGFLAIPLAQLGDVGITLLIRDALDKIEAGEGTDHLSATFGFVILLAVFFGLFRFAQRWFIVSVSRSFERELKQDGTRILTEQCARQLQVQYVWDHPIAQAEWRVGLGVYLCMASVDRAWARATAPRQGRPRVGAR